MVITKLMGGLGNQMFQYAAGRSLARKLKTELKLDLSFYRETILGVTPRTYELDCFRLKVGFATKKEVAAFYQPTAASLNIFVSWLKNRSQTAKSLFQEKHYHFDPDFLALEGDVYLTGYWQSEKYFKAIADLIRQDFAFKKPPQGKNKRLAEEIGHPQAVSLHVRRTDYVTDKATQAFHGTCGLDYYRRAIRFISQQVSQPTFFVFSDDPDWTKKNLHLRFPIIYVTHNQGRGWEDMRLMSLCRHNILANSSFSWWATWLDRSPDKIVIAPKKWFNQAPNNTKDLYLPTWTRL